MDDMPVLLIEDGKVLNVEEMFNRNGDEVPFVRGEIYSGSSWRNTKVIISEENAFVWNDGKVYWGVVSIEQSGSAYGNNHIQLSPCEESCSKTVGISSKYWKKEYSSDMIYYN
jgi:hypothetical protein